MTCLLLGFAISCIEQCAQYYQTLIDQEELEKLKNIHPTHLTSSETDLARHRARLKRPEPPKHSLSVPALKIVGKDFFCVSTKGTTWQKEREQELALMRGKLAKDRSEEEQLGGLVFRAVSGKGNRDAGGGMKSVEAPPGVGPASPPKALHRCQSMQ